MESRERHMYLISSDWHLGDKSIIAHERSSRFDDIEAHDYRIIELLDKWLDKLKADDTFWFLGDFCERDMHDEYARRIAGVMRNHPCRKEMIRGNHDRDIPAETLLTMFDAVHDYPVWVSNRVVLSHFPCAVYDSQVNVHGHTHGMKVAGVNHICASLHVANYNAVSSQAVESALGKCDPWCAKFLYEPWAADYVLTQKHPDAIADKSGRIDLSASRVFYETSRRNV